LPQQPAVHPALLNAPPGLTEWTNLGFWHPESSYADAAAELARRVGRAARLTDGDMVIDFACGFGDSLRLWVQEFGAAEVVGVEPDPAVCARVEQRIRDWGLADRIRICRATAESFLPKDHAPDATAVVCVDAAYHFQTRGVWLRGLAQRLPPGTRIGFSDITISRTAARGSRRARTARVAARAGIPEENLWTLGEIETTCADLGILTDGIDRCGTAVLGGFVRFAYRSSLRFLLARREGGHRVLGAAAAIAAARSKGDLGYAVVAARVSSSVSSSVSPGGIFSIVKPVNP
jgi:SAM-dependent methyltransferase